MAEMNMKYSVLAVYLKSITALNCVLEMSQEKVYCIFEHCQHDQDCTSMTMLASSFLLH